VLGIGALRLHGEPDIAAHHFEVALSLDADDTRAREGLRRALLESGQFGALGSVTADGERTGVYCSVRWHGLRATETPKSSRQR